MSIQSLIERLQKFVEKESRLDTILYLKLVLKPISDISFVHIASERETAYIPVFRLDGKPYIPISSIHGALRTIAENIVKSSLDAITDPIDRIFVEAHCEPEYDTIRHICSSLGRKYIDMLKNLIDELHKKPSLYRYFVTDEAISELREIFERGIEVLHGIPRAIEIILSCFCPICRLFGGPGVESRIRILRVEPVIEGLHAVTRVSIERSTSTARPGHLFTVEEIAIERLYIDVFVKNITPRSIEAKILAAVLTYLSEIGMSIGGRKSTGLGRLKLDTEESRGVFINLSEVDEWRKFIDIATHLEDLATVPLREVIKVLT